MPKDKAGKKKEDPSKSPNDVKFKRQNSLTDVSSTSSSSSSSSTSSSGAESDESSILFSAFEKNRTTMTDGATNTSDAQEALSEPIIFNLTTRQSPIKIVSEPLQPAAHSHFRPINVDTLPAPCENAYETVRNVANHIRRPNSYTANGAAGSYTLNPGSKTPPPTGAAAKKKANGKQKKERKLTKKQRKQLDLGHGYKAVDVRGLCEPQQKPRSELKNDKRQLQAIMSDDVTYINQDEHETSGEMTVVPTNHAARAALGFDSTIKMPYYGPPVGNEFSTRKPRAPTPPESLSDLWGNEMRYANQFDEDLPIGRRYHDAMTFCQRHYLAGMGGIGPYTNQSAAVKLTSRMGFGIAGSGIMDKEPSVKLSMETSRPVLKTTFSELVGPNIENWRTAFAMGLEREMMSPSINHAGSVRNMQEIIKAKLSAERVEWIHKLLSLILKGEVQKVWKRIQNFNQLLIQGGREASRHFTLMAPRDRYVYIVEQLLTKISDNEQSVNPVMYLACRGAEQTFCFRNNHKNCILLDSLLAALPVFARKRYLTAKSSRDGFTALHYAALAGYPCQIDVLLRYGCNLEARSADDKTPLYLACRRPCGLMARQLLWHGADIGAASGGYTTGHFRGSQNNDRFASLKYVSDRVQALESTLRSYVELMLRGTDESFKAAIGDPITDLHTVRLSHCIDDLHEDANRRRTNDKVVEMNFRPRYHAIPQDSMVVLFAIPATYTKYDTTMPACFPHVTRVSLVERPFELAQSFAVSHQQLQSDDEHPTTALHRHALRVQGIADRIVPIAAIGNPRLCFEVDGKGLAVSLTSFFSEEHNGSVYAYNLPSERDHNGIARMAKGSLRFELNSGPSMKPYENSHLMLQAYVVRDARKPNVPIMMVDRKKMD
ncbi:unnamed protein product [Caenorhabditis auriculariae]|uniref:ANK_REP_REGION domain-containing protein n=1 Tax=Caenorhabditis auriculariae TaxID=2777116 RepID=A0A8S1HC79_9PELO|nr:unnamed protein product [Caenorhabditis auriculariae]